MTRLPFALAIVGVLALARPAHAQADTARARAVYVKGRAAYERGDYVEALAHFEQAYRLSPTPALLFNMAQAHRLSGPGHCPQALEFYREYLERDPEASNREEALERVDEMRACVERATAKAAAPVVEPKPAAAPDAAPPAPPAARQPTAATTRKTPSRQAPRKTRPAAAIAVTGVGLALGVAGGILYARARAKYAEVERSCPCPPGSFSDWETLTSVSYGLMAAGVAGTAGGISWYLLGAEDDRSAPQGLLIQGSARF